MKTRYLYFKNVGTKTDQSPYSLEYLTVPPRVGLGMFRLFWNRPVLERGPSDKSFRSRSFFVVSFRYVSFRPVPFRSE